MISRWWRTSHCVITVTRNHVTVSYGILCGLPAMCCFLMQKCYNYKNKSWKTARKGSDWTSFNKEFMLTPLVPTLETEILSHAHEAIQLGGLNPVPKCKFKKKKKTHISHFLFMDPAVKALTAVKQQFHHCIWSGVNRTLK